jgi:hypothetical protein
MLRTPTQIFNVPITTQISPHPSTIMTLFTYADLRLFLHRL